MIDSVGSHKDYDVPVFAFFGTGNELQNGTVTKARIDSPGQGILNVTRILLKPNKKEEISSTY